MEKRIVYMGPEGHACVVVPAKECGLTIEQIAEKDVPKGTPYRIVDAAIIPTDRTFRDAWVISGPGLVVDMPKAREIHRWRLRAMRKPMMEALDVDFMRAMEAGDAAKQKDVTAAKQALRDVTVDPMIEAATTPEALKAAIPGVLKGARP